MLVGDVDDCLVLRRFSAQRLVQGAKLSLDPSLSLDSSLHSMHLVWLDMPCCMLCFGSADLSAVAVGGRTFRRLGT